MLRISITAAALAVCISAPASALELRLANGYPPTSPGYKATEAFKDYVEANSDMTIKVHHSGSLLSFAEIPGGLRDGIADIGVILPPYYPSEFPESNLPANMSMLATSGTPVKAPGAAMVGVMMDYIFNCEDCQAGYAAKDLVYLGALSSSTFDLLCRDEVSSIDDLKGRKIRVGAANFGRLVEHFGATQVAIPANEMYEAVAQGVADCITNSVSDLTGYQMADVTKYALLNFPGGVYSGVDPQDMNKNVWADLTTEQREVILHASAKGSAAATAEYYLDAQRNIESGPGKGVTIKNAPPEMVAAASDFVADDLKVVAEQFRTEFGLSNVDEKMDTIAALVDKWKGIVADWDGDVDELAQIYWDEVFSKVDPETYGMN
jgi:TRAP-type C4-dicarboxylate transport system substrate-binding protein